MTGSQRRCPRLLAAVLAVALAGLTLSGCEPTRAGAAAIVGDQRITIDELARDTAEVTALIEREGAGEADGAEINRLNLRREIVSLLLAEAAAREGVEVTDGEVDQAIEQVAAQTPGGRRGIEVGLAVGPQAPRVPPTELEDFVRDFLIQQELAERLVPGTGQQAEAERSAAVAQLLEELAGDIGVTVNPRFGSWNPVAGMVELPGDVLSRPEAAFTEAPQ